MSLIKNGDGVKVSTFEQVPGNTSYKIKEYIDLNGATIPIFNVDSNYKNKLRLKDTVVIQANLDNYDGYLFGDWSGGNISNEMCIYKTGNQVLWFFGQGGTQQNQIVYARVTYQSGIHLYGFSNGDAIYDNQILSSNQTVNGDLYMSTSKTNASYFLIGKSATGHCIIYRIIISCSDTKKTYSYYPCANSEHKRIYEALATGRFVYQSDYTTLGTNTELNSDSSTVGNNVKYGISLDDIKSITGSKYRDLMAIMTEDGTPLPTNVHPPFVIRDSNNTDHTFAFYLGLVNEQNKIGVNNIYTLVGNDTSIYKPGDLILGRRPKWNIWSNSMPYCIWNRPKQDYNGVYDPDKLVYATYNLTQHWGKNGYVNLADWQGYSKDTDYSAPEITFLKKNNSNQLVPVEYDNDPLKIPYHNGYACYCDIPLPGLWMDRGTGGSSNSKRMFSNMLVSDKSIYMNHNVFPDSAVKIKAGNLINWNRNQLQQEDEDIYGNQLIYGMCATLTHSFRTLLSTSLGLGAIPVLTDVLIGYRTAQTTDLQSGLAGRGLGNHYSNNGSLLVALSSDSSQSVKDDFKDGKIYEDLRITGNEPIRLYNEINSAVNTAGTHTYMIDAVGKMNLLKARRILSQSETPADTDLVYLTDFIPDAKLHIKGDFDQYEIDLDTLSTVSTVTFSRPSTTAGKKTRLIFMNHNDAVIDTNNNTSTYSSKELQACVVSNNVIQQKIPLFFFPVGYEEVISNTYAQTAGTYTISHYKKNDTNTKISVPFVLTTQDLNSYESFFGSNLSENSTVQYKGDAISRLRAYGEVLYCYEDANNEKIIVKDKFTKYLDKITGNSDSIYDDVFGYKEHVFDDSDRTESHCFGISCRPYFWMLDINQSDLPNICNYNISTTEYGNTIPDDITIKFWIQNEDYSSTALTYSADFKYEAINDSWYAPILGNSLYLFVKEQGNEDWMQSPFSTDEHRKSFSPNYDLGLTRFKIIGSHWFKGKMVNMFKFSTTDLTSSDVPSGGTYASPLATTSNGWESEVPDATFTKLWMTERFYANTTNDVNNIARDTFTDAVWTDPEEIYDDDTTNQKAFFILAYRTGVEITNNNLNDYVQYIEGEGFYGVRVTENGEQVVKTVVYRKELASNGSYITRYLYVNKGDGSKGGIESTTFMSDFCTRVDGRNVENAVWVGINPDLSIYLLSDGEQQTYRENDRLKDEDLYMYSMCNKYMFSIDSALTPSMAPNKWITFDQFKALSTTISPKKSEYNFMYHECIVFTLGGEYGKTFEIVQIGGEQNVENFYPVRTKDISKLNYMSYDLNHYKYWYKLGGSADANKWDINGSDVQIGRNEILAPYKINGMNVSIYDIVQYQLNVPVYPTGYEDTFIGLVDEHNRQVRNCQLNISS